MESPVINKAIESINEISADVQQHSCPRCGWDCRKDVPKASEEQIKEYFRCAMAQKPFQQAYELFDGNLRVVFEEPTGELIRLQEDAVIAKNADKKAGSTGSLSNAMDFVILPALVSVGWKNAEFGETAVYKADYARRVQILQTGDIPKEISGMPLISLQAIRNVYGEFSQLCGALIYGAQDENFWKGAGRS